MNAVLYFKKCITSHYYYCKYHATIFFSSWKSHVNNFLCIFCFFLVYLLLKLRMISTALFNPVAENTIAKAAMYMLSRIHYRIELGTAGQINSLFYSVGLFGDAGMHMLI